MKASTRLARVALGAVAAVTIAAPAGAQIQTGSTAVLGTSNLFASDGNAPAAPSGGGAGTTPTVINLVSATGRTLRFTSVAGTWGCCSSIDVGPEGYAAGSDIGSSGSIAGVVAPRQMFFAGVFLGAGLPGAAPPRLT